MKNIVPENSYYHYFYNYSSLSIRFPSIIMPEEPDRPRIKVIPTGSVSETETGSLLLAVAILISCLISPDLFFMDAPESIFLKGHRIHKLPINNPIRNIIVAFGKVFSR